MRRPVIRLQNTDKSHNRYITAHEMRLMLRQKEAIRVSKPKNSNIVLRLIPQPEALRSMDQASPPSITSSEMMANVGIGGRAQIRSARAKIREFMKDAPRHIIVPQPA